MKKLLLQLCVALLTVGILLTGCKKDEKKDKKNHLKIGGTEYNLSSGLMENYGFSSEGVFNVDLTLVSDGITLPATSSSNASGAGQVIYFEMFTTTNGDLDNGEYQYKNTSPYPAGSFDYGDYSINLDIDNETGLWIEITSGTVNVSKNGDVYEITFDCSNSAGEKIEGYYKGVLQFMDHSKKKSTKKRILN